MLTALEEAAKKASEKKEGKSNGGSKPPPIPDRSRSALSPQVSTVTAVGEGNSRATLVELADTSNRSTASLPINGGSDTLSLRDKDSDVVSLISTSSRSRVMGAVRKRGDPGQGSVPGDPGGRGRDSLASDLVVEDADVALGTARALQIQVAGESEGWGVGDEARMNLE